MWQQLEALGLPAGFPRQPSALTTVQVRGSELLAVIGGAPGIEQSSSVRSGELAELCVGQGGVTPTDLWARPLQAVSAEAEASNASASHDSGGSSQSFHRTVLAFPPRPRTGFSLTPLDSNGGRFLLFGGHTGQSGKHGHCVNDTHLLEFVGSLDGAHTPSSCSSGSESEDIFFASDYKVVLKEQPAKSMSTAPAACSIGRMKRGNSIDDDSSSHGSSDSELEDDSVSGERSEKAKAFEKTMRETVMRLGTSSKVKMSLKKDAPSKAREKIPKTQSPISESNARWRLPQQQDGNLASPRVGHVAVLVPSSNNGMRSSILIHGGLDDGGMPLGDTYEVRTRESADEGLKTEWHCIDQAGSSFASSGAAPWEQEQTPKPRACHSAVFWAGASQRCMIIFGGLSQGLEGEPRPLGDTWTLSLRPGADAVASGGWKRPVMKGGAPAKRWGHSSCMTGSAQSNGGMMLLCGGVDASGRALSDCWLLCLEDMRWELVDTRQISPPTTMARRSLGLACNHMSEPLCPQPELGRCTSTWSTSLGAAVVWCGNGFWTCRVQDLHSIAASPQRQRGQVAENKPDKKQKGEPKLGAADMQRQWWEKQRSKVNGEELGHGREPMAADRRFSPDGRRWSPDGEQIAFSTLPEVLPPSQVGAFPGLPDVLPPPRNARWNPREVCPPVLSRVQSEPRMHDSWRPVAPLVRGPGSQSNLMDPKAGRLEASVPWHAKNGQNRLEALPRR